MKLKAVLFDLDGTLLPMVQEEFTGGYFSLLAARLAPRGFEPKELISNVWKGTKAMVKNDGTKTNADAFWDTFCEIYGEDKRSEIASFEEFYATDFLKAQSFCGYTPKAKEIVTFLKEHGIRTVLATNPIFPAAATEARTHWAGLEPEDFEYTTTYENSRYAKPNPQYYTELLDKLGLKAEDCLMVGNDAAEDTAAAKTGMDVFLITDCLINSGNADISAVPQGTFDDLKEYLKSRI